MEFRSPDRNLFLGYVFGDGTRAESMLVLKVEPLVTPLTTPLDDDEFADGLIPPFMAAALSSGLAKPFSSNGGYMVLNEMKNIAISIILYSR